MARFISGLCHAALICATLSACALPGSTQNEDMPLSLDDPNFIGWYQAASPYMRTALFVSLCVADGFNRGSVQISFCVSNKRQQARLVLSGS
ncbi:MAG: hypothetical protein ACPGGG_06915 [Parvibaculales bacterium]